MKLPAVVHNRTSYVGAGIAALALMAIVFLFILDTVAGSGEAPYAGIVIFIVLPSILICGLLLIPVGMYIEHRNFLRTGVRSMLRWPVVDLNDVRQRNAAAIFTVGSIVLLFMTIFGSYQAYEATESVAFCGTTCHTVMEPEYVTYQHSPHARVRCVDCHVGPGAGWYVRSKLSGLYQVYAVLFDVYPRPIPPTIHNLRPAQETCEQCHWPEKFFHAEERRFTHYLADEGNTPWEIRMLIKVGGGSAPHGRGEGIHWHMNIGNHVEYIAADEHRQTIPWVRFTNRTTGESVVYESGESLTEEQIAAAEVRTMDCMDCHNRPSHVYRSPSAAINDAIRTGEIDRSLPFIKKTGIRLLIGDYPDVDDAVSAIERGVMEFYGETAPQVLVENRAEVEAAVRALQEIYRRNFFPLMKARWDVYPENAGHWIFDGCFRCHAGNHRSADGRVITDRCSACHEITAQGPPADLEYSFQPGGLDFKHPGATGDAWQGLACTFCHNGT